MKLVVATQNRGKVRELQRLFGDAHELVLLDESAPEVIEDAPTFEGNALKKARAANAYTGLPALADDSGLEVDALDGAPGVHSARYAIAHDDAANNAKLLQAMQKIDQRTARFRCALAFAGDVEHVEHGSVEGEIAREARGAGGFGYDPLFVLADGRTMAELTEEEKSRISHRADAAHKMRAWLAAMSRPS